MVDQFNLSLKMVLGLQDSMQVVNLTATYEKYTQQMKFSAEVILLKNSACHADDVK